MTLSLVDKVFTFAANIPTCDLRLDRWTRRMCEDFDALCRLP